MTDPSPSRTVSRPPRKPRGHSRKGKKAEAAPKIFKPGLHPHSHPPKQ